MKLASKGFILKIDYSHLVTACLVVHNEEKIIERCLKSIKRVTNSIIVVHDGPCEDNTLTICRKYGCMVKERKHVGMCEGHRVWTYFNAQNKWVLQIDADEFLSEELIENIKDLVTDDTVACYEFLWPYWDGFKYRTKNWPNKKALFQKDKVSYIGFPHEEVRVEGKVKKVPYLLEHRPEYDNFNFRTLFTKHKKWIKIHAQYHLADPSKLEYYPVEDIELKPHYSAITRFPRMMAPFIFTYHFAGLMFLGGGKEGRIGIRNSFMQATYYFLLCLEISRQKREM